MYILRSVHLTNVLNEFYYYYFQFIHCFFDKKNYSATPFICELTRIGNMQWVVD